MPTPGDTQDRSQSESTFARGIRTMQEVLYRLESSELETVEALRQVGLLLDYFIPFVTQDRDYIKLQDYNALLRRINSFFNNLTQEGGADDSFKGIRTEIRLKLANAYIAIQQIQLETVQAAHEVTLDTLGDKIDRLERDRATLEKEIQGLKGQVEELSPLLQLLDVLNLDGSDNRDAVLAKIKRALS